MLKMGRADAAHGGTTRYIAGRLTDPAASDAADHCPSLLVASLLANLLVRRRTYPRSPSHRCIFSSRPCRPPCRPPETAPAQRAAGNIPGAGQQQGSDSRSKTEFRKLPTKPIKRDDARECVSNHGVTSIYNNSSWACARYSGVIDEYWSRTPRPGGFSTRTRATAAFHID